MSDSIRDSRVLHVSCPAALAWGALVQIETSLIRGIETLVSTQSSEIMAKYGVNVPPGIPVFSLDEVLPAAKKMADDSGQV